MGVSLEDVQKGVLDTAKVLVDGMNAWNKIQGTGTSTATPPIQSGTVSQPSVANTQQTQTQSMSAALGSIPPWAWLLGGLGLLWYARGRH